MSKFIQGSQVLHVLKHHRATLKLKTCKWVQDSYKFVEMYVEAGETQYAQSKNEAFSNIEQPKTLGGIRMIVGIFGLYSHFLPLYEMDIRPFR